MERIIEKFTIKITDSGLVIIGADEGGEKHLHFTAGEALMLLDILKNEEASLKQTAEKNSPMPVKITFG